MVLLLSILFSFSAQGQFYDAFAVDLMDTDGARSLQIDRVSGGYVTTGSSLDPSGAVYVNLVAYDIANAVVWSRFYDFGTGFARATAVEQTVDSGYVITGQTISPATGLLSPFLIKTDYFGNIQWSQTYDFYFTDGIGRSVEVNMSAFGLTGYVLTGGTTNPTNGTRDMFLLTVDPFGAPISWNVFDTGADEEGMSVDLAPGSVFTAPSYTVAGWSTFGTAGGTNVWLSSHDGLTNMVWGKVFGGAVEERGMAVEHLPSGEIFVGGFSNSFSNGNWDMYLSMHDPAGGLIWSGIYGQKNNEQAHSVEVLSDGSLLAAGWTDKTLAGDEDAALLRLDPAGGIIWARNYGGPDNDRAYSAKEGLISSTGFSGDIRVGGIYGSMSPATAATDQDIFHFTTDVPTGDSACAQNPKFKTLPVLPIEDFFVLPGFNFINAFPVAAADPDIPWTQEDVCCGCSDMAISFTYSPTTFCVGDPVTFTNTSDCIDQFRWFVDGVVVASTPNLTWTFSMLGAHTVTLGGKNTGCPAVFSTVSFNLTCRLAREDVELELFPNPASDQATLMTDLDGLTDGPAQIEVIDITGRRVRIVEEEIINGRIGSVLDLSDLAPGTYQVVLHAGQTQAQSTLVIE